MIARTVAWPAMRRCIELLSPAHYEELCTRKDALTLSPNWPGFESLAEADALSNVILYDGDTIAGYSLAIVTPHLHYRDTIVAYEDLLFLSPEYRVGTAGGRLMKAADAAAKLKGATMYLRHAKPGTALDRILSKRRPVHEHIYAQSL